LSLRLLCHNKQSTFIPQDLEACTVSPGVLIVIFKLQSVILLGFVVTVIGCGGASDAPTTAAVTGVVTYQGKPMPNLSVAFIPEAGMLATGTTDADGRFEMTTSAPGDGAVPGMHKVAINFVPETPPEMPGFPGSENVQPSPIPLTYADVTTSGLTVTVDSDSSKNDFKFDLTGELTSVSTGELTE
jgi:hypothetical protein